MYMVPEADQEFWWNDDRNMCEEVTASSGTNSVTCNFENMQAGSYTLKLDFDPYSYNMDTSGRKYNMRLFGKDSEVHLYDGRNKVTEARESDYAAPAGRIGDEGVDLLDEDDEEYGGNDNEVCTAAGCVSGGGGDSDDSGNCTDNGGVDAYGDTCEWYDSNVLACGDYDTDIWSANGACCSCGGGAVVVVEPVDEDPVIVDNSAGECSDDSFYADSYGDGCDWYNGNAEYCGAYDSAFMSSFDACCACGGGDNTLPACLDDLNKTDAFGDGCAWYTDN